MDIVNPGISGYMPQYGHNATELNNRFENLLKIDPDLIVIVDIDDFLQCGRLT